jgi:chromosome segregation ATPase
MDGNEEVITVLKEIRDEARQTNARLDQTNARLDQTNVRLESLEGRVDSLEHTTADGFAECNARLNLHAERWDVLTRRQAESEMRLATEIVSLATITREVRDLLREKLEDHDMVIGHEHRIKALEARNGTRHPE